MDVFAGLVHSSRDALRDAAVYAAHALGVFGALGGGPMRAGPLGAALGVAPRRLRALLDVLVLEGALCAEQEGYACAAVPAPPPAPPPQGWGLLAEVIRRDRPLSMAAGFASEAAARARFHQHLGEAGAAPAARLMERLSAAPDAGLLDIGAGVGTYAAAWLARDPRRRATLVDQAEVLDLARAHLSAHGERVRFDAGDFLDMEPPAGHDVALLCNVLHLHPPETCARLVERAARAVAPGGAVVVKDLLIEEDRRGPAVGVYFALNMALFTDGGDVYDAGQVGAWMEAAGLVEVRAEPLPDVPDTLVLRGRRPPAPA